MHTSRSDSILPFSHDLKSEAFRGEGEYTVRFFEAEEEDYVASVNVRQGQVGDHLYQVQFQIVPPA